MATAIMGLDHSRQESIPVLYKDGRVTATAIVDLTGPAPKVLLLMMGGNHFTSRHGRAIIATTGTLKWLVISVLIGLTIFAIYVGGSN